MKKILSIIMIIVLSTILGLAYNASTNLSLRLLEATDDVRPFREDFNYNFELVDDIFDDVSLIEFSYLDGVTSAIQDQIDAVVDTSGTPVDNDIAVFTDLNTIEGLSYSELKAVLDLEIGTDVQAYDDGLLSIAGLTTAANDMIYTTALDTYAIMDTFAELQAVVADKTLVNEEDIFTIDANWVNTANPWADNEVSDTLTSSSCTGNAATVTVDAATSDTTCFVLIGESASGSLEPQTDATLTYNANTGVLTSTFTGNLLGNVTGALTGQADTVGTIAGLAPNTATTQATQASITTCANLTTVGTIGTGVWEGTAVADGYVPNNITIDLATLATTVTCTDNESEDLDCAVLFADGYTTAQGVETDGDFHYSPDTGLLTATSFAGNPLHDVTTSSSTNTLTVAEAGLILVSDAHTETLPTAVGNVGLTYHFIKTDWDYDLITLEGDGSETFNYENSTGSPNLTYLRLNTPCAEVTIVSDGSNWQVINERLGQVPYAHVYLAADQENIANTTWTKLLFDTETADIGSNFNVGTSLFTCPVSGYYAVLGHVIWFDGTVIADKLWMTSVTINGTDYPCGLSFHSSSTSGIKLALQNYLELDKDDTIELRVYHNGGAATPDIDGGTTDLTSMIIILKAKE